MHETDYGATLPLLRKFATSVYEKLTTPTRGEPEAQLHAPVANLIPDVATHLTQRISVQAESRAADRLGIPDFAVTREQLLVGFIELKAPGVGADTSRFTGRNRDQWERFRNLPNILYTDGSEWALYQDGQLVGRLTRFSGLVHEEGARAITRRDAEELVELLRAFFSWSVIPPENSKELAGLLAPACRMLRTQVADSVAGANSPLSRLAQDWRDLLFPKARDDQFADAYAQTVTFALLMARADGADPLDLATAIRVLADENSMLSRSLQVMTDPQAKEEIRPALRLVQRMIASVDPAALVNEQEADPWLYFYEDFLAAYDPQLRKDAGAYYTPLEVVHAQVRLVDELLSTRFERPLGFAEGGDVVTLDPAAGTGTYLLGVIEHAMKRVSELEGPGAVPGRATLLAQNIHGFELMTGPYAVAQLRISQAIRDHAGRLQSGGAPVYLTNTLDSPYAEPPATPLFLEPIAQEHRRALRVKEQESIFVCIGNPPYDRHPASSAENRAMTGGWIRYGDDRTGSPPILDDFLEPAREAGYGIHLKNAYNLYVYFWRWAIWKVFEHESSLGPGIVSFITASSYLDGDAFVGLREHLRKYCDDVWIIDLGGEGRGTRRSENVFNIQTPVAIAIAVRNSRATDTGSPAKVRYVRLSGSREEKLGRLDTLESLDDLSWQECPREWGSPFRPQGSGAYFTWPRLSRLMPWQHSGAQVKRLWPIGPTVEVLHDRWRALLESEDRAAAFKETRDRRVERTYSQLPDVPAAQHADEAIADLPEDAEPPPAARYSYRSFDRQYLLADNRLGDFLRPVLWQVQGERQLYFSTLVTQPLDKGPALTVSPYVPDLDHFRGSYGSRSIVPLFRDADATLPNIAPGFLERLARSLGVSAVTAEEWASYLYAVLASPAFTSRFRTALMDRQLRVPITKEKDVFQRAIRIGRRLIRLHCYGERFTEGTNGAARVPAGSARVTRAIDDDPAAYPEDFSYDEPTSTLRVGGGLISPVEPRVWSYEVSGLKVVTSWLGYRMRSRRGRRSSPLDEIQPSSWSAQMTRELLELLWIIEHTIEKQQEQVELLDDVLEGAVFEDDELEPTPAEAARPPSVKGSDHQAMLLSHD